MSCSTFFSFFGMSYRWQTWFLSSTRLGKVRQFTANSAHITVALSSLVIQLWCMYAPGGTVVVSSRVGWPDPNITSQAHSGVSAVAATSNNSDRNIIKSKLCNFYVQAHLSKIWRLVFWDNDHLHENPFNSLWVLIGKLLMTVRFTFQSLYPYFKILMYYSSQPILSIIYKRHGYFIYCSEDWKHNSKIPCCLGLIQDVTLVFAVSHKFPAHTAVTTICLSL